MYTKLLESVHFFCPCIFSKLLLQLLESLKYTTDQVIILRLFGPTLFISKTEQGKTKSNQ
jgi:hypothetical protein